MTAPTMRVKDCAILYNPNSSEISVVPLGGRSAPYLDAMRFSEGGVHTAVRRLDDNHARMYVMSVFISAVVRDRVDIDAAHREFLKIDEYQRSIAPDIAGAFVEDDG